MLRKPEGIVITGPDCPVAGGLAEFALSPDMVSLLLHRADDGSPPDRDTTVLGIVLANPSTGLNGNALTAMTAEPVRLGDLPRNLPANVLGCIACCGCTERAALDAALGQPMSCALTREVLGQLMTGVPLD